MINALRQALTVRVEDISFRDNIYNDEEFVASSIKDNFAGWYREEDLSKQIDFILQHCAVNPPAKVLDAACGHGRHCDLLSRKGFGVTGTDISEQLIAYLEQAYSGKRITFKKQSFKELDYRGTFDLVIVLGNSLSLIPREEITEALRNLSNALKSSGTLFMEFDNRKHFIRNEAGKCCWNYAGDRWLILSRHHYDSTRKLGKSMDISIDFQNKRVNCSPTIKCLYDQDELSDSLNRAGMTPIKWFGDWDGNGISDKSPSVIVVAKKKL